MLEIYQELVKMVAGKEQGVLVTIIRTEGSVPRESGSKMLIKEDGVIVGTIGGGDLELGATRKAMELLGTTRAELVYFDLTGGDASETAGGERVAVFFEPVTSPETLYIFGAGHIAQPLAAIAGIAGFRVVVIDPRPEFNNRERFPEVAALLLEDVSAGISSLKIRENDYIVVATPSHRLDEERLELALTTAAKYIGMVGSKRKMASFREHLTAKGVAADRLEFIHTPIGLGIGAKTPEEIAVSILAEMIAVRRGKGKKET